MKAKPKSKTKSKSPPHSLTDQQEVLSSFFEKAPFPIALFKGVDMVPVAVNDAFMRLVNKKKERLSGQISFRHTSGIQFHT